MSAIEAVGISTSRFFFFLTRVPIQVQSKGTPIYHDRRAREVISVKDAARAREQHGPDSQNDHHYCCDDGSLGQGQILTAEHEVEQHDQHSRDDHTYNGYRAHLPVDRTSDSEDRHHEKAQRGENNRDPDGDNDEIFHR